jgi:peptidoglycan hydrolase-like protein with peptidoglycan-binding domain
MSHRSGSRRRRVGSVLVLSAALTASGVAIATPVDAAPVLPAAPGSVIGLQYGDYGPEVRLLQEALIRVGVGVVHGVDGYFGSATRASVRAWQNHKGLPVTGTVDEATAVSLNLATAAPAPAAAAPSGVLAVGARGRAVAELQLALINRGYVPTGGVDGIFGAATKGALQRFQTDRGLGASGQGDAATLQALGLAAGASSNSPAASTPPSGQLARGSRGSAVVALQQALLNRGIAVAGGADGIFGPATETALKQFQASQGLEQTGALGPRTTAALGLGGSAPAPAPAPTSAYVGLRLGSTGPAVAAVQRAIANLGFYVPGGADGIFGGATQSAVMLVQKTNGIPASGQVDDATARLLGLTGAPPASTPSTPSAPVSGGSTAAGFASYDERGPRVVALQQALINAGQSFRGGADGVFGSATVGAIIAFQKSRGLTPTGKVDSAPAAPVNVQLQHKVMQGPCYYGDTWGAARSAGRSHLGVDIGAAEGQELYAVVTGRITQIYVDAPGSLAGNGLKIATADGTYFFYAHLKSLAPGIQVGTQVTAGQLVGWVGKTGNAGIPHLHLEIHPGGGSAVNPYPIVKAFGAC